jgi:hypothetical protein
MPTGDPDSGTSGTGSSGSGSSGIAPATPTPVSTEKERCKNTAETRFQVCQNSSLVAASAMYTE